MKDELTSLCADLEHQFDHHLDACDQRLRRLEKEMSSHVENLLLRHPEDLDIRQLAHLSVGFRNTQRLLRGRLEALKGDGDEQLINELGKEIKTRIPEIRQRIEECDSDEQAAQEIQREMDAGTSSFKNFFRGLLLWHDTPEDPLNMQDDDTRHPSKKDAS
ncbi:MAG: hypothetical protein KJO21_09135 [Verrucomicrobiae bacterium]|nr:hypothetical protein [Verrucomicrobiae bacterium]NNJ43641.1 hypothetical protein [Akkermansiaceae bacterium]